MVLSYICLYTYVYICIFIYIENIQNREQRTPNAIQKWIPALEIVPFVMSCWHCNRTRAVATASPPHALGARGVGDLPYASTAQTTPSLVAGWSRDGTILPPLCRSACLRLLVVAPLYGGGHLKLLLHQLIPCLVAPLLQQIADDDCVRLVWEVHPSIRGAIGGSTLCLVLCHEASHGSETGLLLVLPLFQTRCHARRHPSLAPWSHNMVRRCAWWCATRSGLGLGASAGLALFPSAGAVCLGVGSWSTNPWSWDPVCWSPPSGSAHESTPRSRPRLPQCGQPHLLPRAHPSGSAKPWSEQHVYEYPVWERWSRAACASAVTVAWGAVSGRPRHPAQQTAPSALFVRWLCTADVLANMPITTRLGITIDGKTDSKKEDDLLITRNRSWTNPNTKIMSTNPNTRSELCESSLWQKESLRETVWTKKKSCIEEKNLNDIVNIFNINSRLLNLCNLVLLLPLNICIQKYICVCTPFFCLISTTSPSQSKELIVTWPSNVCQWLQCQQNFLTFWSPKSLQEQSS